MKQIITYNKEDVYAMKVVLNGINVTGIQNCKQIAALAQLLENGISGEIKENDETKQKEGDN